MAAVDLASSSWDARREECRSCVAQGRGVDAMKALMFEMRDFLGRPCVQLLVEQGVLHVEALYRDPVGFGLSLVSAESTTFDDSCRIIELLLERGQVFSVLDSHARAVRDLEAVLRLEGRLAMNGASGGAASAAASAASVLLDKVQKDAESARLALDAQRIPITLLTGFLGAGKTTLLNYILRTQHGFRYAVIENEVGQVGIDNQLLEDAALAAQTSENVVLLDNGCMCCTVRADLVEGVKKILARADAEAANRSASLQQNGGSGPQQPALHGILIESTGLADPGPVVKTFYSDEDLLTRTRVDGVLTVVDACHFLTQLRRERSAGSVNESEQQVGFADKLLLNKVDLAGESLVAEVSREISRINQIAPIIPCSLSTRPEDVPLNELLSIESFSLDRTLREADTNIEHGHEGPLVKRRKGEHGHGHDGGHHDGHSHDHLRPGEDCEHPSHGDGHGHGHGHHSDNANTVSRHDNEVTTCVLTAEGAPIDIKRFQEMINSIRAEHKEDLYRYKGVLCIREPSGAIKRAVLQGVHDICEFQPRGAWPAGTPQLSQVVFIGRKLQKDLWSRLFEKCRWDPSASL